MTMFRSNTKIQPQYKMKHRLTGAVIIVALAVIVISVLLKEPESQGNAKLNHHDDDSQTLQTTLQPLNLDTVNLEQAKLQKTEVSINAASATAGRLVLTADKKSNSDSAFGLTAPKTIASPQPPVPSAQDISADDMSQDGWSVRVGTYADAENVDSVSALLSNHGFQARHTQVQTTLGMATRIWLGPYTRRAAAEKVSLRLKAIIGEKGYVTEHSS